MNKSETYNSPLIEELLQVISPEKLKKTEKRMLLAARIDDAIKERGWKRKEFANALGKTPSEITKWLSGTHNFTSETLFDIEQVLNINLLKLDYKQDAIIETAIYNYTIQSSYEYQDNGGGVIYNELSKKSFC